jgi:hypothetical protein
MLGVVDKFISNIFSKSPPKNKWIHRYKSKQYIIYIFIIMVVETESKECQPVGNELDLFKIVH